MYLCIEDLIKKICSIKKQLSARIAKATIWLRMANQRTGHGSGGAINAESIFAVNIVIMPVKQAQRGK
jgi:hypothetical protein